jgi:hypothetical protein
MSYWTHEPLIDVETLRLLRLLGPEGLKDIAFHDRCMVSVPIGAVILGWSVPRYREAVTRLKGGHPQRTHYRVSLREVADMRGGKPVTADDLRHVIEVFNRRGQKWNQPTDAEIEGY